MYYVMDYFPITALHFEFIPYMCFLLLLLFNNSMNRNKNIMCGNKSHKVGESRKSMWRLVTRIQESQKHVSGASSLVFIIYSGLAVATLGLCAWHEAWHVPAHTNLPYFKWPGHSSIFFKKKPSSQDLWLPHNTLPFMNNWSAAEISSGFQINRSRRNFWSFPFLSPL